MSLAALLSTYGSTSPGEAAWVRPDAMQTLEDFQLAVAAAEALEFIGRLRIVEIREENRTGRRLIKAVHIRRLK